MNYYKHYKLLIKRAKERQLDGYKENHHIIPTCIGGTDDKSNRVDLTAREHFIAHILLVKIYPNEYGLIKAVNMMSICDFNNERTNKNRMYGWLRERFSKAMSEQMSIKQKGELNSQFGSMWIHNLELKISKKIDKNDLSVWIENGWLKGRIIKFDKSPRKPRKKILKQKIKKAWVSNLITEECLSIELTKLDEYLKNGFVNKKILNFVEYKRKESKKITKYDLQLEKSNKAKKLFSEFGNGDYKSLAEFAAEKFDKKDITSFRYLWIKYIDGFNIFLKEAKSKNIGITSIVIREKFGEFA